MKANFPHVPQEVAKYWLYEHWGHSPFAWIPSAEVRFELVDWAADDLKAIRSRWCDYSISNQECLNHGHYLLRLNYRTAAFMKENRKPPTPIIVLDNRTGHFKAGDGLVPKREGEFPASYVLIEGHRRFNLALALHSTAQLAAFPVWLMRIVD